MTNEEVILAFMGWTPVTSPCWPLDLDALREVEERLTEEQWISYVDQLHFNTNPPLKLSGMTSDMAGIVHASADQKIRALGEVLGEPKGEGPPKTEPSSRS